MKTSYPNLELIEYIYKAAVRGSYPDLENLNKETLEAQVFIQVWPNSATGFSEPGMLSGQMVTREYTTVLSGIYEKKIKRNNEEEFIEHFVFGVFFGNELGYLVVNPNQNFMDDLNNKNIANIGEARSRYQEKVEEIEEDVKVEPNLQGEITY